MDSVFQKPAKAVGPPKGKFYFLKTRKFKTRVFLFMLLAWPLAHFAVFWVYINSQTIFLTLFRFDNTGYITGQQGTYFWVGLENYINVFQSFFFPIGQGGDVRLRRAFLNSFLALPLNVMIILPIAFICSYAFFKKVKLTGFFRVVFFFPSIISIVILTMVYRYMFDGEFGPLYHLFYSMGIDRDWFQVVTINHSIWPLIFIFCIWAGMGSNVILLSSAMARVPTEVLESARIDGVGFWRECFQIILPLIWGTMSTLIVFGTMAIFGFMMQPFLLAGIDGGHQGQAYTIALHIFNVVQGGEVTESTAISMATFGVLFCLIGGPLIFLSKWITEKFWRGIEF